MPIPHSVMTDEQRQNYAQTFAAVPVEYLSTADRQHYQARVDQGEPIYAYFHTFDWTVANERTGELLHLTRIPDTACSCCRQMSTCPCTAPRCEECGKCYQHCWHISSNPIKRALAPAKPTNPNDD